MGFFKQNEQKFKTVTVEQIKDGDRILFLYNDTMRDVTIERRAASADCWDRQPVFTGIELKHGAYRSFKASKIQGTIERVM